MSNLDWMSWDYIKAFFFVVLGVCALIVAVLGCIEKVRSFRKPKEAQEKNTATTLSSHEEHLQAIDRKLDHDNARLNNLDGDMGAVLLTMHTLLEHMITGNSVQRMRDTQDKLTSYMVNRGTPFQTQK